MMVVQSTSRGNAPVFVLGCPRSGTTFLYYTLLSSGKFAVYPEESSAFNVLGPRFGDLGVLRNRQRLMKWWLGTRLFTVSGLDAERVKARILAECRNPGDFLRIVMGEMVRLQNVQRWAETTNEHLLFLPDIKKTMPDALVIHVLRDGRDVALSMEKVRWLRSFPWNEKRGLLVSGSYWKWLVGKGRQYGRQLGPDYMEVRYEDLVEQPRETLERLGCFIDQNLDYDEIRKASLGAVGRPNTSFKAGPSQFNPIGRWRRQFPPEQLTLFESVLGGFLKELDYRLATPEAALSDGLEVRALRAFYPLVFDLKFWIKANTPILRLSEPPQPRVEE
jgi:Sulfotransferase family